MGMSNEDPFLAALDAAIEDDEPATDSDRDTIDTGLSEYARGETVTTEVLRNKLGLDDYEPCWMCGYDHEYETSEARKWHAAHPDVGAKEVE